MPGHLHRQLCIHRDPHLGASIYQAQYSRYKSSCLRISVSLSYHLAPLDLRLYMVFTIICTCPDKGPNSGPALMHIHLLMSASRYAFAISVGQAIRPLRSAVKMNM